MSVSLAFAVYYTCIFCYPAEVYQEEQRDE